MRRLLLVVAALAIPACGGNPNSPSSTTGNTFAQVAGNWTGNLQGNR